MKGLLDDRGSRNRVPHRSDPVGGRQSGSTSGTRLVPKRFFG